MTGPPENADESEETAFTRRRIVSTLLAASATVPLGASAQVPLPPRGGGSGGFTFQMPGGRQRNVADKLRERASLLDFDVDPAGRNDSSPGFHRAIEQIGAGQLFVPRGVYLVQDLGILGAAGLQIIGDSRWKTIFRTEAGGRPLFYNQVARTGTSAFHLLSDFMIDLNGEGGTALDLGSINASTVQRLHITGGRPATLQGVGVRFAAPIQRGAYDNALYDCSFEYLECAVVWETGANANSVFNCRVSNCRVGYDAAPGGEIDTPRIFGGRVEGCSIGLREGAAYGGYYGVRFEDNDEADIVFTTESVHAGIWGGFTASSRVAVKNLELARSPHIESSDIGNLQIEESDSRARVSTGRHVLAAPGKMPPVHPARDYAAYFHDYMLLRNQVALECAVGSGEGRVVAIMSDAQGELTIPAFNRQTSEYGTINLGGGGSIRPLRHAVTNLGDSARAYKTLHLSDGVFIEGKRVLEQRQPAITDDRSGLANSDTVNRILSTLRRHGLIES